MLIKVGIIGFVDVFLEMMMLYVFRPWFPYLNRELENPARNNKLFESYASFMLVVLTSSFVYLHQQAKDAKVGRNVGVLIAIPLNVIGLVAAVLLIVMAMYSNIRMTTNPFAQICSCLLLIATVDTPSLIAIEFVNLKHKGNDEPKRILPFQVIFWILLVFITLGIVVYFIRVCHTQDNGEDNENVKGSSENSEDLEAIGHLLLHENGPMHYAFDGDFGENNENVHAENHTLGSTIVPSGCAIDKPENSSTR